MTANAGVSFDSGLAEPIGKRSPQPKGFGANRGEAVNAVLTEFFEAGGCTTESGWEGVSGRWTMRRAS